MDHTLWRKVVPQLAPDHRVVAPDLPLGAHPWAMRPDADLTLGGQARIVADFLEALELEQVTLVSNDWGGALLLMAERDERLGRMVLAACETYDNYPPGLPGKVLAGVGALPGGLLLMARLLRLRALRRLPFAYGWMAKRPVPDEIVDGWLAGLQGDRAIRRDLRKYVRGVPRGRRLLMDATLRLERFDRPVLLVWGTEDRVMPVAHGRRLAQRLERGRLVELDDCYTLIPEDRPEALAREIGRFARDGEGPG